MPSIKVRVPDSVQHLNIPAFGKDFCAGVYEFTDKDIDLIRFLLRYPQRGLPIDPQEIADKGFLPAEEVAGFGYEIVVKDKKTGEPVMDKETGKPALVNPDTEKAESFIVPEAIPTDAEFGKMSIAELKDWADDPDHPVKYESKWNKEQYVKACCRAAKKLRK